MCIRFHHFYTKWLLCYIFACFYVSSANAIASIAGQVSVDLKASVYVFDKTISLGDIADIKTVSGSNDQLLERLNMMVVDDSPKPGVPFFITKEKVMALIAESKLVSHKNIIWNDESIVKVNSHGELLRREAIIDVAHEYFDKLLSDKYAQHDITQTGIVKDKIILSGALRLVPDITRMHLVNSRNCIWVNIFVNDALQTTVQVWFKTKVYSDVLVASQSFNRHDRVQIDKLQLKRIDVAGVSGDLVVASDVSPSLRYSKAIKENDVITYENIEPAPLIEKGSLVNVTATIGKVRIKNKAIALSDGEMFDKIMVYNRTNSNSNTYPVVVMGDQEVAINVQ